MPVSFISPDVEADSLITEILYPFTKEKELLSITWNECQILYFLIIWIDLVFTLRWLTTVAINI
jgi:hypothetical protein